MMRSIYPVIALLLALSTANVAAQVSCRTELSYKWKKGSDGPEEVVFWGVMERSGENEEQVKRRLEEVVAKEKGKASASCRELHENLSGCVASRFSASSAVLAAMSFSARKALEEAISKDCHARQGSCGAVTAGEPTCLAPPAPAESAAAPPAEEKGKKKK
jgi:hypothetical protein